LKRRELIKKIVFATPATLVASSAFSSTKKEDSFSDINYKGKIIIIGAGISGMYAAYLLHQKKVDTTVLEASNVYGGRVRALYHFSDFPIELGVDEIQGGSIWHDLVKSTHTSLIASANNTFFIKGRSHLSIFEERFGAILDKIKLNTQIKRIDYTNEKIVVEDQNGNIFYADKVIITVPLSVLKDSDIQFAPSLPDNKINAIEKLKMDVGIKIILKFSNRFWGATINSISGTGIIKKFKSISNTNILTAFVEGERSEKIDAANEIILKTAISELDTLFGSNVASSTLLNSKIINWGKESFIKGSNSFSDSTFIDTQKQLAAIVNDKLFFAGEATNYNGNAATVHGAMETAERAVTEITKSIIS
jgi:monoamine oxidase